MFVAPSGPNQSLQPTAGRCDDQIDLMKQFSMFAALARTIIRFRTFVAPSGPNQSLQPTAGRCDDQIDLMKQFSMFAALAPTSGG